MIDKEKNKKYVVIFWMTFIIAVIAFIWIFVSINNRFKESSDLGLLTINTTEDVVPNDYNLVSASSSEDKSINEVQNSVLNQIATGKVSNVLASTSTLENQNTIKTTSSQETNKSTTISEETNKVEEEKKELSFIAPVARRNYNRLC